MIILYKFSWSRCFGVNCRRFGEGFFDGAKDELKETFTNNEISIAHDTAKRLEPCHPWTDHLPPDGIQSVQKALNAGKGEVARAAIEVSKKPGANKECIEALLTAVIMCASGAPDILWRAVPGNYFK